MPDVTVQWSYNLKSGKHWHIFVIVIKQTMSNQWELLPCSHVRKEPANDVYHSPTLPLAVYIEACLSGALHTVLVLALSRYCTVGTREEDKHAVTLSALCAVTVAWLQPADDISTGRGRWKSCGWSGALRWVMSLPGTSAKYIELFNFKLLIILWKPISRCVYWIYSFKNKNKTSNSNVLSFQ